jgi:hypothetical protein
VADDLRQRIAEAAETAHKAWVGKRYDDERTYGDFIGNAVMAVRDEELERLRRQAGWHGKCVPITKWAEELRDKLNAVGQREQAVNDCGAALAERNEWRERAEKAEAITNALTWLIAAGVQITIGACNHQGGAELRVAVDLDDNPAWYGDLSESLTDAKTYCSAQGVEP